MTRAATAGVAGLLAALSLTGPAHAEDEITIDHVETAEGSVSVLLSVDRLPAGLNADGAEVEVSVDGRQVDAAVKTVADGDIERATVLVLDASNSMRRGGKFDAAKAAVTSYLATAPEDVRIGLVSFAGKVSTIIEPTTDHASVTSALESLTLRPGTSVYDGIAAGIDSLGSDGSRSLLILSDGADTGSTTTLEVVSRDAAAAGIVVDVVSLAAAARADELAGLADATNGSVVPADPAALATVFGQQADALAEQLLITFVPPADATEDASVDVALTTDNQTFHDSALVSLANTNTGLNVVDSGKALVSRPAMLMGSAALALGLAGLLAVVLVGATNPRTATARRLDAYFDSGIGTKKARKSTRQSDFKGNAVAMTEKMVTADVETRISQRLAGAGSALTAAEWILLHAGIAVGAAAVAFLLGGGVLGVLGLLGGVLLPWFYLKWRHGRRLGAFNAQLAQTLGLMAGGLQAGLSLPQAVDSVVREGHQPMAGELNRALVEQRLGIDITDALDGVGQRMESPDFGWVVMAIRIQREVGGNLAEILHTVAETLREREYLRRQVRALSAEGRISAYILAGLPVVLFIYMIFANREYVSVLYTTLPGYIMLAVALGLLGLGSFTMSKLVKVEV